MNIVRVYRHPVHTCRGVLYLVPTGYCVTLNYVCNLHYTLRHTARWERKAFYKLLYVYCTTTNSYIMLYEWHNATRCTWCILKLGLRSRCHIGSLFWLAVTSANRLHEGVIPKPSLPPRSTKGKGEICLKSKIHSGWIFTLSGSTLPAPGREIRIMFTGYTT